MFGATGSCTTAILGAIFAQASRSQQIATFIQQDEWPNGMCAHNSAGHWTPGREEGGLPHNGLKLKTVNAAARYRTHSLRLCSVADNETEARRHRLLAQEWNGMSRRMATCEINC